MKPHRLACILYFSTGFLLSVSAQSSTIDQQNLIAASQAGASPLFFYPEEYPLSVISPSHFNHPNEFFIRDGLPNLFYKLSSCKEVIIGYLGGSITRADNQYRQQSAKFIQSQFPKTKVIGINAGISGTGTDLGACRLYEQLLKYNPDIIFVEFAVNGAFAEGMEGIIRQIWKYNQKIDICLIYTITDGIGKAYTEGKIPEHISKLDILAQYYGIPSVHLGMEAAFLEKEGKLIWKGNVDQVKNKVVFSADGVHPLLTGGNLYAESIARALLQMKENAKPKCHFLPTQMYADNWEDAHMIDPSAVLFDCNWTKIYPTVSDNLNQFSGWFSYLMKAEVPGASFSFSFDGSMFGLFDIGGPEVGQLELQMDGKPLKINELNLENYIVSADSSANNLVNRFNRFCNNRYRGQCFFVKVMPGRHEIKITISSQIPNKYLILGDYQSEDIDMYPKKYNRTVEYVGKILIRGRLIDNNKHKKTN